nr:hypothetical protein CFP56_33778 [Quercus suber]
MFNAVAYPRCTNNKTSPMLHTPPDVVTLPCRTAKGAPSSGPFFRVGSIRISRAPEQGVRLLPDHTCGREGIRQGTAQHPSIAANCFHDSLPHSLRTSHDRAFHACEKDVVTDPLVQGLYTV